MGGCRNQVNDNVRCSGKLMGLCKMYRFRHSIENVKWQAINESKKLAITENIQNEILIGCKDISTN